MVCWGIFYSFDLFDDVFLVFNAGKCGGALVYFKNCFGKTNHTKTLFFLLYLYIIFFFVRNGDFTGKKWLLSITQFYSQNN